MQSPSRLPARAKLLDDVLADETAPANDKDSQGLFPSAHAMQYQSAASGLFFHSANSAMPRSCWAALTFLVASVSARAPFRTPARLSTKPGKLGSPEQLPKKSQSLREGFAPA